MGFSFHRTVAACDLNFSITVNSILFFTLFLPFSFLLKVLVQRCSLFLVFLCKGNKYIATGGSDSHLGTQGELASKCKQDKERQRRKEGSKEGREGGREGRKKL